MYEVDAIIILIYHMRKLKYRQVSKCVEPRIEASQSDVRVWALNLYYANAQLEF